MIPISVLENKLVDIYNKLNPRFRTLFEEFRNKYKHEQQSN